MGLPVLILLAAVWAAVLIPPFLRHRSEGRPGHSVSRFSRHLAVLGRTMPGGHHARVPLSPGGHHARVPLSIDVWSGPGVPVGRTALRRRRQNILIALAGTAGFTLLLAIALRGPAIPLHLLADVALGGYVFLLVQLRKDAAERTAKVRYLPVERSAGPVLVPLRQSASQ